MSSTETRTLPIRITSSGKINLWVKVILGHFEEMGNIPVVLHTLPSKDSENTRMGAKDKLPPSVTTVPKLVTVVEIVKREFLKRLAEKKSSRLKGLHQYNEVGILEEENKQDGDDNAMVVDPEEVSGEEKEERRARDILTSLSGKNHVKRIQTPFMRVTLSMYELPELVSTGATYQPPKTRKIPKSAKARARKREAKQAVGAAPADKQTPGQ